MLTAGYEVPESPAKKPESTSEESTSEESKEDDDDFYGDGDQSEESEEHDDDFDQSEESEEHDDDFYGDGLHKMTDQERAMYAEAVRLSDGFDVPSLPNVFALCLIQPAGSGWPAEDIREFADFAIEDQNEKRKKEGRNELRLKEVIKCNVKAACPLNYYITLKAEDVITREVDEYEAMVMTFCGEKDEVHIFRKKNKPTINPPAPTEHGPSDLDCAVEDPGKICESRSWDRGETRRRRL